MKHRDDHTPSMEDLIADQQRHIDELRADLARNRAAGSWKPKREKFGWVLPVLATVGSVCVLGLTFAIGKKAGLADQPEVAESKTIEKIITKEIPAPPPPLPDKFVPGKAINVAELFNGIQIESQLITKPGERASIERGRKGSYVVKMQAEVNVPAPLTTSDQLAEINPDLPSILPGLTVMTSGATVSGFFHHLYETKKRDIERDLTRLDRVLSVHNYFDCETVLEMRHPSSGQRCLWLQGEMDVVADGSDGDREETIDQKIWKSTHYQPSTSYGWNKRTAAPNPLLGHYQTLAANAKAKAAAATNANTKKSLLNDAKHYETVCADLKARSFLIAAEDPFVVIPLSMRRYVGFNEFAPQVGDYVVVIHGKKLLPAIVGDYGPGEKTGEASLRVCLEIDPKSTPYQRPESDLKISYLYFPGTAEKPFGPPNYAQWHARCTQLLEAIGGVGAGYTLHQWEDRIAKRKAEAQAAREAAAAKAAADKAAAEKALADKATEEKAAAGAAAAAAAGQTKSPDGATPPSAPAGATLKGN